MMEGGCAARLLLAFSLMTLLQMAMAKEDLLPNESHDENFPLEQIESQPETDSNPALPVAGSRGQLLYENHCQTCHTSVVHVRETHRARSLKDLEYWVTRWSSVLKLSWSSDEISDVVDYLNRRYYKIEEPSKQLH